ncbi:MAG: PilZ domain-containing protein [Deltaproteobacteria bacterium]|nr:PilZ domain-containing protein [Deltaproteobacteria bacterium]
MGNKTDRRASARCIANCQCWVEQESITLFGTVTNLSTDGLFLQTLPILDTGTVIDIRISLQDIGDLQARGKVAWKSNSHIESSDGITESAVPGLGIQFQDIKEGKELLPEYISRRSVVPPPVKCQ